MDAAVTTYFNTAVSTESSPYRRPLRCTGNAVLLITALAEEYQQLKIVSLGLHSSGNTILSLTPIEFVELDDNEFRNDPIF